MTLSVLLLLCGVALLLAVVGQFMVASVAFHEHWVWGLVAIFAPCGFLICSIRFWQDARTGFFTGLAGSMVAIGLVMVSPDLRAQYVDQFWAGYRAASEKQGGGVPPGIPGDHTAELANVSARIANYRSRLEILEATFSQDGVALMKQYQDLDRQRKALPPNDTAAVEKFNIAAAAYQAGNARRKQMQQDITKTRAELDQLLDARSRGMPKSVY